MNDIDPNLAIFITAVVFILSSLLYVANIDNKRINDREWYRMTNNTFKVEK